MKVFAHFYLPLADNAKLMIFATFLVLWNSYSVETVAALSCYCDSDGPDLPCMDVGEISICEFNSTVKRVQREGGGTTVLADDLATCVAVNHPDKGLRYACGWGSHVTDRMCTVLVDRNGVLFEMCRCNTKNFCNQDFFENQKDVSAVETTTEMSPTIINVDEKTGQSKTTLSPLVDVIKVSNRDRQGEQTAVKDHQVENYHQNVLLPKNRNSGSIEQQSPENYHQNALLPKNRSSGSIEQHSAEKTALFEALPNNNNKTETKENVVSAEKHQVVGFSSTSRESDSAKINTNGGGGVVNHANLLDRPEHLKEAAEKSSTEILAQSAVNENHDRDSSPTGKACTRQLDVSTIILKLVALSMIFHFKR